MSHTSTSFFFESKVYIFWFATSKMVTRVVSSITVSVRIFRPLMKVVDGMVPDMPMPLPVLVCLMVTSAPAGAAKAARSRTVSTVRVINPPGRELTRV